MADGFTEFEIGLRAKADVAQAEAEYDRLFAELKSGLAEALKGEGASPEFIAKFNAGLDEIRAKLDASGQADDFAALNAEVEKLVGSLREAATAEAARIEQLKLGMQTALAEKDAQEAAQQASARRREEDQLAAEIEDMAAQKRIATIQQESELRRAAALGRQMSAEQAIEREAAGRGAYSPAEEVERLRRLEEGTRRVGDAKRALGVNAGMAALEVSRLFEDMQYGIAGALNNIPNLVQMLGLGAGLAGVISIASVALVQLWNHFGGAKDAERKADDAKEGMDRLRKSLEDAAAASDKAFQTNLDKYLQSVTAAADQWARNKDNIQEALQYQNQLAAAELRAAQARLEVERQGKLGAATTAEEREGINADFDVRKARLSQAGEAEAMQRALEAQKLMQGTLQARINESQASGQSAQDVVRGNRESIASMMDTPVGRLSNEASALKRLVEIPAEIQALERLMKERLATRARMEELGVVSNSPEADAEEAAAQAKLSDLYKKRDELEMARPQNEQAIKDGKVSFGDAEKIYADDASMTKAIIDAQGSLRQYARTIDEALPAIKENEEQTKQLKLQLNDLLKRRALLEKESIALQEETKAAEAKQATDQKLREQKAAEDKDKKEREAQALQKENDAREATAQGRPMDAVKLRAEAGMLRLPPNATPEDRRRVALEADAAAGQVDAGWQRQAETLGNQAAAWAKAAPDRMGRATAAETLLANIAQQLEDGGDVEALDRLADAIHTWGAKLSGRSQERFDKILEIERDVRRLESQMRNGGRR